MYFCIVRRSIAVVLLVRATTVLVRTSGTAATAASTGYHCYDARTVLNTRVNLLILN